MPTRIYSEDSIKKRKILSGDEKPTRKYTKTIKQEIKKEPLDMDMSDGDIDDDDVMDIEEADGTMPKKGKLIVKQKRIMKSKKIKKIPKLEKDKDGKDIVKVKPKRKKKISPPTPTAESTTPAKTPVPPELPKSVKKTPKIKEKKVKPKPQKPTKKTEKDDAKANNSDSDSSPEESDAYETCGVVKCQRPSGKFSGVASRKSSNRFRPFSESVQDWILCDGGCEVWYHMVCVGLKIKEVKPDMEFICNNCKQAGESPSGSQSSQK